MTLPVLVPGRPLPDRELLAGIRLSCCSTSMVCSPMGVIHFDRDGMRVQVVPCARRRGARLLASQRRSFGLSVRDAAAKSSNGAQRSSVCTKIVLKRIDKATAFEEILARQQVTPIEVAYVGDDLLDLPVLQRRRVRGDRARRPARSRRCRCTS
jgi:hypothetical protein